MLHNLLSFTNNSIVICKMIVGRKPPLCKGRWHGDSRDGGIVMYLYRQSPSQKSEISASPLYTRGPLVRCNICKGERYMKATGIVRRVDDLGRIVIPKEIRRTLKIREGDPSQTTLTPIDRFCIAIHSLAQRITAE